MLVVDSTIWIDYFNGGDLILGRSEEHATTFALTLPLVNPVQPSDSVKKVG